MILIDIDAKPNERGTWTAFVVGQAGMMSSVIAEGDSKIQALRNLTESMILGKAAEKRRSDNSERRAAEQRRKQQKKSRQELEEYKIAYAQIMGRQSVDTIRCEHIGTKGRCRSLAKGVFKGNALCKNHLGSRVSQSNEISRGFAAVRAAAESAALASPERCQATICLGKYQCKLRIGHRQQHNF